MKQNSSTALDFAHELDFSQILTNPILDIAARFWEEDRYEAFRICYRSMRRIDDLVDDRKKTGRAITADEAAEYKRMIRDWMSDVKLRKVDDPFQAEFLDALDRFAIPFWPWERLAQAMIYDLEHDSFENFMVFRRYAEGAAVSPAAVFMHLCGVNPSDTGYVPPAYDIRKTAQPLALFSYLVHIIRDFQKDQLSNLNYFAEDLLAAQSLSLKDLRAVAEGGPISREFRNLMGWYKRVAEFYRCKARSIIDLVSRKLPPRYRLSLEIIYELYLQIHERIDPADSCFSADELNPLPEEIQARINQTIERLSGQSIK